MNITVANFLKLKLTFNDTHFNILCVYRFRSNEIEKLLISIDDILKADCNLSGYYMTIGDLNINIVG